MTVRQLWVQAEDYTARDDRLLFPLLHGVALDQLAQVRTLRHPDDFAVTWIDGTHADVGAGWAYIGWAGTLYVIVSDEATALTFGAADPANARIDTIAGRVYDAEAGGPDQPAEIAVIAGQPSQTPIPPAVPAGAIALYDVRYNAGATSPLVTDRRPGFLATSAAGTRVWKAPDAEVWVSRPSANGGAWRRASDVLYARVARIAAFPTPTSLGIFGFDTITEDAYGLCSAAVATFRIPFAGLWQVTYQVAVGAGAVGQFVEAVVRADLAGIANRNTYATGAGGLFATAGPLVRRFTPGQGVDLAYRTSVALNGVAGSVFTFGEMKYAGSGG